MTGIQALHFIGTGIIISFPLRDSNKATPPQCQQPFQFHRPTFLPKNIKLSEASYETIDGRIARSPSRKTRAKVKDVRFKYGVQINDEQHEAIRALPAMHAKYDVHGFEEVQPGSVEGKLFQGRWRWAYLIMITTMNSQNLKLFHFNSYSPIHTIPFKHENHFALSFSMKSSWSANS